MAKNELRDGIAFLRGKIREGYDWFRNDEAISEVNFRFIDEYLKNDGNSDLEKAFFLILNQYPGDQKDYIVRPKEMVLVPDVYDMNVPGIEYEIDFALYGGSVANPVKVAVECDGLRSHGKKHTYKDRRKDVNLQAAGWITMRFGSREIHEEIEKFRNDDHHMCYFLSSIENTIARKLKLINSHSYYKYRTELTGYNWGEVKCPDCGYKQDAILNHLNVKCKGCKKKFKRTIDGNEKIKYEQNGILFFEEKRL